MLTCTTNPAQSLPNLHKYLKGNEKIAFLSRFLWTIFFPYKETTAGFGPDGKVLTLGLAFYFNGKPGGKV